MEEADKKQEVTLEDLKTLETRVATLEKNLGIHQEDDIDMLQNVKFIQENVKQLLDFNENIDRKYEFNKVAEVYREIKPLLENPTDYKNQMVDMKKKVDFVEKSRDDILEYHKLLDEVKELRNSLTFKPVFNVSQKMKELNKLNKTHLKQAVDVKDTREEITGLIENYNDLIEAISQKFAVMDMQLTKLEQSKQ